MTIGNLFVRSQFSIVLLYAIRGVREVHLGCLLCRIRISVTGLMGEKQGVGWGNWGIRSRGRRDLNPILGLIFGLFITVISSSLI